MTAYPKISLKKGREYQILRGHPWLFSGGISQAPGKVAAGSLVDLVDTNGRFVARGYYNPKTDIAVRVLTKDEGEEIDSSFFCLRVGDALELRKSFIDMQATDAYRLVHAEGDFLPGYVVDRYGDVLVVQSHTAGADQLLPQFIGALRDIVQPRAIVVRNDSGGRKREGLETAAPQVVQGDIGGEIIVSESGVKFAVDVIAGQKTGFFTDQREKRQALQKYCRNLPAGASMINGFCYTGGFSVYAILARRHLRTINIDESQRALDQARRNFELNDLNPAEHEFLAVDAFPWLEQQRAAGVQHEVVVLDPPAFAKTHKDKPRALKGYTRLARLGIAVTKERGLLVVCSCSGSVTLDEFTTCLKDAAADTQRQVQILEVFQNGPDHPVSVGAPESNYLKVLFCRVI